MDGIVLRPADAAECERGGLTPDDALRLSVQNSMLTWVMEVEGEVAAVWGFAVRTFMDITVCYAWMLTTPICELHRLQLVRASRYIVAELQEQFENIEVIVDDRHMRAVDWLRWLGFELVGDADVEGFVIMRRSR